MTDEHLMKIARELGSNLAIALSRTDTALDNAVRVIDRTAPPNDFERLIAIQEPLIEAELWLSRAIGFITALRIVGHPDTKAEALATAAHTALEEIWLEFTRLQSRLIEQHK